MRSLYYLIILCKGKGTKFKTKNKTKTTNKNISENTVRSDQCQRPPPQHLPRVAGLFVGVSQSHPATWPRAPGESADLACSSSCSVNSKPASWISSILFLVSSVASRNPSASSAMSLSRNARADDCDICIIDKKALLDGFINCVCFYIWTGLLSN